MMRVCDDLPGLNLTKTSNLRKVLACLIKFSANCFVIPGKFLNYTLYK